MIAFGREQCIDLEFSLSREWLETNGLGGFASSTIAGINTRRYHGLLVAATTPPAGRTVLLSKLEETLILDGRRYDLSANQYGGAIHPCGYQYLKEFRLAPFPVYTYRVEEVEVRKSIFMVQGENTTAVHYEVSGQDPRFGGCGLEIRPLIAFRDYHSTTHHNAVLDPSVYQESGVAAVCPYRGLPTLYLGHNAQDVETAGYWYYDFEYQAERERGLDFKEDLFNPFTLKFDMNLHPEAALIASTEKRDAASIRSMREAETRRRYAITRSSPSNDGLVTALVEAADQYIVARDECKTVIAGYHWFADWGRDTMIALPGLALVTGRYDAARSILKEFLRYADKGMLPNRFPDAGETPEYNTVDATLWYFEAVRTLAEYTGDYDFIRKNLYAGLVDIVDWHVRGTRYGIGLDSDGLLGSGAEGVQLTWMDARVGELVVTPRRGKPVEIQALWYNALRVMESLARRCGDEGGGKRYGEMASRASTAFNRQFWNEDAGCLYDVVDGDRRDASIRPNQIFAVSLLHTMLSPNRARQIVEVVARELLTPYGLRSLAPSDPRYAGRYEGDPASRDGAYHQGTVWAWLMGPFISAYIRVNGETKKARQDAARLLEGFHQHLSEAGLGQISEIFDGDSPHAPRGGIAQAWSVAEILRAAVEDVFCVEPAFRKARSSS
jgi:predicted glycogen debranching enzyme